MKRVLLPLPFAAALAAFACADSARPTAPAARSSSASAPSRSNSSRGCRDVKGTITEWITGPNTAAGTVAGDISGDVNIVISDVQQSAGGVVQFHSHCTFVASAGTITTSDNAVLTPIEAPLYRVNNHLDVTGGTDSYDGVSGNLHTHGTVNFVPGGLVDLRYEGQLCDPR